MKIKKIAIDISPTIDQNSKRGVGFYTKNLINALQEEIKTNSDYQDFKIDLIKHLPKNGWAKNYDLVHYPFFDPFKLSLPKTNIPTIVTVHDLIPRQYKKHYPVGIKGEINWLIQKTRLKKSNFIITDSHSSKYQIKKIINYPVDQIYTVYLSADSSFKPIKNKNLLQKTSQKYNLPKQFVLYVGDINWNKNIPRLVKACLSLKYPLVIVGSATTRPNVSNHPWNQDLLWLQAIAKQHKNIKLTGFLERQQDLVHLYNLAKLYCQPSIAEGFGLPVLEAMACGCPVAYSLKSSIAEIADYNGQPFNPLSQISIQKALKTVWISKTIRRKYKKLGLIHSSTFSWQQTALQTLSIYQLVLLKNEK